MKATNHDPMRKTTARPLSRAAGSSRAETAVFLTLGLVSFAAVAIALVSGSIPAGSKETPLAGLGRLPMVRYVRSGQLAADARTLAAMVHYFFQTESPMQTNVAEFWPNQKNVAMPTNSAPGRPKA